MNQIEAVVRDVNSYLAMEAGRERQSRSGNYEDRAAYRRGKWEGIQAALRIIYKWFPETKPKPLPGLVELPDTPLLRVTQAIADSGKTTSKKRQGPPGKDEL